MDQTSPKPQPRKQLAIFGYCSCSDSGVIQQRGEIIKQYVGFMPPVYYTISSETNRERFPEDLHMPGESYAYLINYDTGLWTNLRKPTFPDADWHTRVKLVSGDFLIDKYKGK